MFSLTSHKIQGHNSPCELGNDALSGYAVISFIHNRFHLLVSSGTIYSLPYPLERNGLLRENGGPRLAYRLGEKGEARALVKHSLAITLLFLLSRTYLKRASRFPTCMSRNLN